MSIRILPQRTLETRKTSQIIRETPLILKPELQKVLIHRLKRFEQLEQSSDLANYHTFCSRITEIQLNLSAEFPFECSAFKTPQSILESKEGIVDFVLTSYLPRLIQALQQLPLTEEMTLVLIELSAQTKVQNKQQCHNLLNAEFDKVPANHALLLWNAMMVVYRQIAAHLNIIATAEFGEKRFLCPICHAHPVASEIAIGKEEGLRYLHCSLCETKWHVPRAKCSYCDNLEAINYYSIDELNPNIKAEACPKCKTYLKVINREKAPNLDIIADDLDSILLDEEMQKMGFAKSGRNPFLF